MPSSCLECTSLGSRGTRTIFFLSAFTSHLVRRSAPAKSNLELLLKGDPTKVSSFHSIPFALLASVYENPGTEPVCRPNSPCKLGPILFPSPSPRVWHCAQRVLKRLAPFFASPAAKGMSVNVDLRDEMQLDE